MLIFLIAVTIGTNLFKTQSYNSQYLKYHNAITDMFATSAENNGMSEGIQVEEEQTKTTAEEEDPVSKMKADLEAQAKAKYYKAQEEKKAKQKKEEEEYKKGKADAMNPATNATTIPKFKRYDKVVIATKIHGKHGWNEMIQSMCLLHYAYNHQVLYDIVVFSTEDLANDRKFQEKIRDLEAMVAPANISVVADNRGLQEEFDARTPSQQELLLARCNITDPKNLTWQLKCPDKVENVGKKKMHTTLGYHWQAEFRSIHIWNHPAIANYRYMLWMDSDGFATREWKQDPVEYFIENEGVVMFDNFPKGHANIPSMIQAGFNRTLCNLQLNRIKGHFIPQYEGCNQSNAFPLIHGFFHITDLDFYREERVVGALKRMAPDCFLCRNPDDQVAVTLPAALFAPEKAWDMSKKGFKMMVFHNFVMDGKVKLKPAGFRKHWKFNSSMHFPTADANCKITEAGR